ncbi:MAG: eCIS core domain-containing protein, partial [Nostoc sp.]
NEAVAMRSLRDTIHRKCAVCEEEYLVQPKSMLQRSGDSTLEAEGDIESRLNSSKGGGSPLPDEVRSFMEPRFGADFSQVRVHTGSDAVQMNRELNAQAFTHKQDVYFGAGKSPGKNDLTAHELTHVVQQTGVIHHKLVDIKDSTPHLSKKQSTSSNEES